MAQAGANGYKHIVASGWELWKIAKFARVATRWQLRSGSPWRGGRGVPRRRPGMVAKVRTQGRARPPARSQHICPPNPWHQPARERRPLIVLLRLLHSQLGRSYSIRYRSEVVEVYNLVVIQQCRSLPQEPGAGQSLVGAAQGGRCTALPAPCGAPLPRHLILLDR